MYAKGEDLKEKYIFTNVQKELSQEMKTRDFSIDRA
jgi:hypothetical protein